MDKAARVTIEMRCIGCSGDGEMWSVLQIFCRYLHVGMRKEISRTTPSFLAKEPEGWGCHFLRVRRVQEQN